MTSITDRLEAALADRYTLERELGRGGMATVYLARDVRHARQVAIKVLHPELAAVLGAERFLAEIKTTANLQHPHILPLFDSGSADGQLFYVMPFVEGETLRGRLDRETQLPIDDAVRIAREVADALQYAHERGVIHRDIKPENILLQGGHALVADFGIALAVQHAGGQRMTQTGLSLGTPQYMAPEQAMGDKAVDARADIYALGAVTYEMLAGEPPFVGPTAQAIVARVLTSDAPALATQRKSVPPHIAYAVHHALEKLPADRFATATQFTTALATGDSNFEHARTNQYSGTHQKGSSTRRTMLWLATATALGALGGWGIATVRARAPSASAARLTFSAITAPESGTLMQRRSIALSPDGSRLAFVFAAPDGTREIWIRRLDEPESTPLSGTKGAEVPFWSPGGRSLGFFAEGFLMVRDADGTVRQLCAGVEPTSADWGVKDDIVYAHRLGISVVRGDGSNCRRVIPRDSGSLLKAAILPDGERFVYARRDTDSLTVAGLDGKTIARLPLRARDVQLAPPNWLALTNEADSRTLDMQEMDWKSLELRGPRTTLLTGMRSAGGEFTLAIADDALVFLPGTVDRPYLEYDGTGNLRDSVRIGGTWTLDAFQEKGGSIKVALGGNLGGLWMYDLESDRATRLVVRDSGGLARRRLGGTYPIFSSDGRRLAYMVMRPEWCDIIVRDLITESERALARTPRGGVCPKLLDWSSDQRELLAESDSVLQIVPLDGSAPRVVVARPGRVWDARMSPDWKTIAYSSDETGRTEVYVRPLSGGTPTRISQSGGRWPSWGKSNGQLYFLAPDGRVMVSRPLSGPRERASEPRVLFSMEKLGPGIFEDRAIGFSMLGNGERFFVRQSPSGTAFTLVRPWTQLLRRADSARVTITP